MLVNVYAKNSIYYKLRKQNYLVFKLVFEKIYLTEPNLTFALRSINLESRYESFHLNQKTNENIFVFLP